VDGFGGTSPMNVIRSRSRSCSSAAASAMLLCEESANAFHHQRLRRDANDLAPSVAGNRV
jgi:hypothetical protein